MKVAGALAGFLFGILSVLTLRADTEKGWMVLWYPWEETHSSWDWRFDGECITIQPANNEKFPESVLNWGLAICSVNDAAKRRLVPLPNPMEITPSGQHNWRLERWIPGNFPLAKPDTLDGLGEGTLLCAIIGDGHRYSNVARVTIRHGSMPDTKPGITLAGISFPGHLIHEVAMRIVPAPENKLYLMDIDAPFVSVDGRWSDQSIFSWDGQNTPLKPGVPQLRIISLDFRVPRVASFRSAKVQVKLVEDYQRNWLLKQHALPGSSPETEATAVKSWAESVKGPMSPVFTLSVDDRDTVQFEHVFGMQ
jgi:hypothetical protein